MSDQGTGELADETPLGEGYQTGAAALARYARVEAALEAEYGVRFWVAWSLGGFEVDVRRDDGGEVTEAMIASFGRAWDTYAAPAEWPVVEARQEAQRSDDRRIDSVLSETERAMLAAAINEVLQLLTVAEGSVCFPRWGETPTAVEAMNEKAQQRAIQRERGRWVTLRGLLHANERHGVPIAAATLDHALGRRETCFLDGPDTEKRP